MIVRHAIRFAIACGALTVTLAAAVAQQGSTPGRGPGGMGMGPGMMGPGMMGPGMGMRGMGYGPMAGCMMFGDGSGQTYAEGRLAFLKAELGITDVQKAQWDAYATALKKNLENMQSMQQAMMGSMASADGSPVERLDLHITAMEARLATLKGVKPALAALYGAFNEEQKKKANAVLTGMGCMM